MNKIIIYIGAIITFVLLTISSFPTMLSVFYLIAPTQNLGIFLIMPTLGLILTFILYFSLTKKIQKTKLYILNFILHLIPTTLAYLLSIISTISFYYWIVYFSTLTIPLLIVSLILNFIIINKVKQWKNFQLTH